MIGPAVPSGWLDSPPVVSRWLDAPTRENAPPAVAFPSRPIAQEQPKQAPSPVTPTSPPTATPDPQTRWYWTTQGWLWGFQDQSGFVHPVEIKR